MTLRPFARAAAPLALVTLLGFGCATVRAPASAIEGDVTIGPGGADPQVELWLESGGEVSEAEKAEAVAEVRRALDRATSTLVSDDGEELLVVRAQGISRTGSRRADQTAAKVGIAVGAVAMVAIVVAALVAGKGGGGGGGGGKSVGGIKAAPPRVAPPGGGVPVPPSFKLRAATARAPVGIVAIQVPLPQPGVAVAAQAPARIEGEGSPGRAQATAGADAVEPSSPEAERTAFPPPEPITIHLPPPRPLDVERRKFFDKDFTRLELIVVDRASGQPTWVKTVEGPVDPRDARAVKALLASAIEDRSGWERAVPR